MTPSRATGVRVRETVPDTLLDRADEVINVDVTVEELRTRMREGRIYRPEKIEHALTNFFRKGNLSTLRELALRLVADDVSDKAAGYRAREGLEPPLIPERVMVCMSSNPEARGSFVPARALLAGWARAGTPSTSKHRPRSPPISGRGRRRPAAEHPARGIAGRHGRERVKAGKAADGLIAFAQREGVTHVIFGQTARSAIELLWKGSTLDRFLRAVPDATVQVVPL